jgi:hypothetical protein
MPAAFHILRRCIMADEKKPNHEADIQNANKGTSGTNSTYDKAQGNRGKQLDPQQGGKAKKD